MEHNDPQIVYSLLEIAQKYSEEKAEKEALPDLVFTIEPWQIEKDTMTGIYVQFSYGRYDTGIMKIPDFMLEQKVGGRYEVHFNYKDTFYFLSEDSSKQNKFVKDANLAQYLSGKSGSIPKRKNSAIQSVREMVTALNIISARQVNSDQAPKVLGKDFHDNFWLVQEVQKQLNEKLLSANERLKFNPNDQELLAKVKVLREEKNELEKEMKVFEKQLKTYDAALSILNEKGFTEFGDL